MATSAAILLFLFENTFARGHCYALSRSGIDFGLALKRGFAGTQAGDISRLGVGFSTPACENNASGLTIFMSPRSTCWLVVLTH